MSSEPTDGVNKQTHWIFSTQFILWCFWRVRTVTARWNHFVPVVFWLDDRGDVNTRLYLNTPSQTEEISPGLQSVFIKRHQRFTSTFTTCLIYIWELSDTQRERDKRDEGRDEGEKRERRGRDRNKQSWLEPPSLPLRKFRSFLSNTSSLCSHSR